MMNSFATWSVLFPEKKSKEVSTFLLKTEFFIPMFSDFSKKFSCFFKNESMCLVNLMLYDGSFFCMSSFFLKKVFMCLFISLSFVDTEIDLMDSITELLSVSFLNSIFMMLMNSPTQVLNPIITMTVPTTCNKVGLPLNMSSSSDNLYIIKPATTKEMNPRMPVKKPSPMFPSSISTSFSSFSFLSFSIFLIVLSAIARNADVSAIL